MTTICTICARGGSKGLPGKNIKMLAGKPMIVHSIEQALHCEKIDRVFVSTDCERIASIARSAGAEVPFIRPAELSCSKSGKLDVIAHLVSYLNEHNVDFDTLVDLDPTSPLREVSDIENCLDMLSGSVDAVITGYPSDKNPYFNMVEKEAHSSNVKLVKPLDKPVLGRQSAPIVYSMNASIYVWHKNTINKGLWGGNTHLYEMPRERSVDVDSLLDFKLVELLIEERRSQL